MDEEQIEQLEQRIAALEETVALLSSEGEYSLGYSGEAIDGFLQSVDELTAAPHSSAARIGDGGDYMEYLIDTYTKAGLNRMASRLGSLTDDTIKVNNSTKFYGLCVTWDSWSVDYDFKEGGGATTISRTCSNILPSGIKDGFIVLFSVTGDENSEQAYTTSVERTFYWSRDGQNIRARVYLRNDYSSPKTGTLTVTCMVIGAREGGSIVGKI
ncbi:MAG: hypothetical protein IJ740_06100 [Ruminococcus sp.]|nr:hypothetical protein [Ruminococcus sp.]